MPAVLSRLEPHSTVNQGFLLTSINCFCDSENCLVGQLKQTAIAPDIACRHVNGLFVPVEMHTYPAISPSFCQIYLLL